MSIIALTIGHDFRLDEDMEALQELSASIAAIGVLQPLTVRRKDGGWQVIAGRRRLAAARLADLTHVPCHVCEADDELADEIALMENLHRKALSPIEVAIGFKRLQTNGLTAKEIGIKVGRSMSSVQQYLSLLKLPAELQEKVHLGLMSYYTALYGHKATGKREGGNEKDIMRGSTTGSALADHWRQRHDRLIAGVQQVRKKNFKHVWEVRDMLDKLVRIDVAPLGKTDEERDDWRNKW